MASSGTVVGASLVGVSLLGIYGSLSGYLGPMIAALFYPDLIQGAQDGGGSPAWERFLQDLIKHLPHSPGTLPGGG